MFLAYCILLFAILSLATWIYQATILPSIRQRLRFELFYLRDQLRELVITRRLKEDSAAFQQLHRRLNTIIKAIPAFDLAALLAIDADHSDLKQRALRFLDLMNGSIPEVQVIYQNALRIMAYTLFANSLVSLAWMTVGAIPVAISQGAWKLCAIVLEQAKTKVLPAFVAKENELEFLSPGGFPISAH
jgi:hypothetical protein